MADEKKEQKCADCPEVVSKEQLKGAIDGRMLCARCWQRNKHIHKVGEGARKSAA